MDGRAVGAAAGSAAREVMSQLWLCLTTQEDRRGFRGWIRTRSVVLDNRLFGDAARQAGQGRATQAATEMDKELVGVGCHGR